MFSNAAGKHRLGHFSDHFLELLEKVMTVSKLVKIFL